MSGDLTSEKPGLLVTDPSDTSAQWDLLGPWCDDEAGLLKPPTTSLESSEP